jgi:hypothetical protein
VGKGNYLREITEEDNVITSSYNESGKRNFTFTNALKMFVKILTQI